MQWIPDGPNIPDALLQRHADGNVVFFCGAGLGCAVGLPGFRELTEKIFSGRETLPDESEKGALREKMYDRALHLLGRRLAGGRRSVLRELYKHLSIEKTRPDGTSVHSNMLELAQAKEGETYLIVTNFDRMFESVMEEKARDGIEIRRYQAPLLPVGRKGRWSGLVYLHGLLPENSDDVDLQQLIVTSGDFGRAYLTDGWASKFLTNLFFDFTVCFVGYSVNDPVVRYMMDALAVDAEDGRRQPAYAFAYFDEERGRAKKSIVASWRAKGVEPIPYERINGSHELLYQTLGRWADVWRQGIVGKEGLVEEVCQENPLQNTQDNNFSSRLLWALTDHTGFPARKFADATPTPSFAWMSEFTKRRYGHDDLSTFGIDAGAKCNSVPSFSLLHRPVSALSQAWITGCTFSGAEIPSDPIMNALERWAANHWHEPDLLLWAVGNGEHLTKNFRSHLHRELKKFQEHDVNVQPVEHRGCLPEVPRKRFMCAIWQLYMAGRVKTGGFDTERLHEGPQYLADRRCVGFPLRSGIRELLAPMVELESVLTTADVRAVCDVVDMSDSELAAGLDEVLGPEPLSWSLVLRSDRPHADIAFLIEEETWLAGCVHEIQTLLQDALRILEMFEDGEVTNARIEMGMPEINPQRQTDPPLGEGIPGNWMNLIVLLRDAWLASNRLDPVLATHQVLEWAALPHVLFQRLALFGATESAEIQTESWFSWLLDSKWVWENQCEVEMKKLLERKGDELSSDQFRRLDAAIRKGPGAPAYPSRSTGSVVSSAAEDENKRVRVAWVVLNALRSGGVDLGEENEQFYQEISKRHFAQKPAERRKKYSPLPKDEGPSAVAKWLKSHLSRESDTPFNEWQRLCRENVCLAADALEMLADGGDWPKFRWMQALNVWSSDNCVELSVTRAGGIIRKMPEKEVAGLGRVYVRWLKAVYASSRDNRDFVRQLCIRRLEFAKNHENDVNYSNCDGYQRALSAGCSPIGQATSLLPDLWLDERKPDEERLSDEIQRAFDLVCDAAYPSLAPGRVSLAQRLDTLFWVDREWTHSALIPLLNWDAPNGDSVGTWAGVLLGPAVSPDVLVQIEQYLPCAPSHHKRLGNFLERYAWWLVLNALHKNLDDYEGGIQKAMKALPRQAIVSAAHKLYRLQNVNADDKEKGRYWRKIIAPLWRKCFPRCKDKHSDRLAHEAAWLAMGSGDAFPDAVSTLEDWFRPFESAREVVRQLAESDRCEKFPPDVLRLLKSILNFEEDPDKSLRACLNDCLDRISEEELDGEPRRWYRSLKQHLDRR